MGLLTTAVDFINKAIFSSNSDSAKRVDNAYNTVFTLQNRFKVNEFFNSYFELKAGLPSTKLLELFEVCLTDFNVCELQNTDIEEWVNYKWSYTTGRPNINKITFTFRDVNGSLLYSNFKHAWWVLKDRLPEDQRWSLNVDSINDYNQYGSSVSEVTSSSNILNVRDAVLDSVSGINLDKSNPNDFITFSITFRYFINYVR